jgi:predicted MFS family arabinose efflux permease
LWTWLQDAEIFLIVKVPFVTSKHKSLLPAFFLGNVLVGGALFTHAFLYNFYLGALGLDESVMGLAQASLTAGGLVALLPAGRLVDRLGVRAALVAGALLAGLGLGAGAVVEAPLAIYAAAIAAGAGAVTWRISMAPYIMARTRLALRSRVFSWNVALLVASGAGWMIASGGIAETLQAETMLTALGAHRATLLGGALLSAVAVPLFVVATAGPLRQNSEKGSDLASAPEHADRDPRSLGPSIVAIACWMVGPALVTPFFNIFFSRQYQLDVSLIGVVFGVAHLGTALVMVGSGEAAARTSPRSVLRIWMALFPPVLLALAATGSVGLAVGLYFLQGLVSPATNPLIDELLLERAAPSRRGTVSSWRNAATEIAGITGAGAGGLVLRHASFDALFGLAGAVGVLGGLALWVVLQRRAAG